MGHMSATRLEPSDRARYARQISLAGFGEAAQADLLNSHVLVIGAGGLGAPVLSYLAAVGIGTISIIDPDVIELSNLHRQVIHSEDGLGERKVDSAGDRLRGLNSSIEIRTYPVLLDAENALDLISGVDLVVDGSDNFATRYLANDACEILGRPLVWGTILGFDGQVAVFDSRRGATLRDLYPNVPAPGSVPDCATAGVLGPLCGSIGSAMAMEAIKVLTGIGTPLFNAVAIHSSLDATWETVPVARIPGRAAVTALDSRSTDYGNEVAAPSQGVPESARDESEPLPATVTWAQLSPTMRLIDIRDDAEVTAGMVPGAQHIPMDTLLADSSMLSDDGEVALYCRSGVRSSRATAQLRAQGMMVSSVSGGYLAYLSLSEPPPWH